MSVRRRPSTPELFDDCDSNGNPAAEVNIDFDDCGSDDENRWVQSPKAALKELYPDLSDDAISLILRNSDQNQNVDKSFSEHNEKNELHEVADQDDSDGGSANGVSNNSSSGLNLLVDAGTEPKADTKVAAISPTDRVREDFRASDGSATSSSTGEEDFENFLAKMKQSSVTKPRPNEGNKESEKITVGDDSFIVSDSEIIYESENEATSDSDADDGVMYHSLWNRLRRKEEAEAERNVKKRLKNLQKFPSSPNLNSSPSTDFRAEKIFANDDDALESEEENDGDNDCVPVLDLSSSSDEELDFIKRKPRFPQPVTSTPTSAQFKIPKMPLKPFSKQPVVESENISRRRIPDLAAAAAISHSEPRLGCGDRDFIASLSANFPSYRSHPEAETFRNDFKRNREILVAKLFKIFNENVFEEKLKNLQITWSKRLTKTAGICRNRYDANSQRNSLVELSEKILDSTDRLRDTLIHELCHAMVWLTYGLRDGHGKHWRYWTIKAMNCFPELPPIRRCHSYSIKGKYIYRCVKCFYVINRHSKSIDVTKTVCGYCKGPFELLLHNPKDPKIPKTPKQPNAFALFVKANYSSVKKSGAKSHRDAMKQLGEQFRKLRFPDDDDGKEN